MNFIPDPPRIPQKYWDIYGDELKVHGLFKVLGINPETNTLEASTVAVMSAPTEDYIKNCKELLDLAVDYIDYPYDLESNPNLTPYQQKTIADLAKAITIYDLLDSQPQTKAA
jgi:hypothetical protein